ncbi:MAG: serine/threonine protein kinase, partial [Anaerolineales bacterium]|nr:serine/threonine protein kinase [Anaerolineales bacterium]
MNTYIGTKIDQYLVTDFIARGGMAEVYLGQDTTLERPVALKVMLPELVTDETFVARFQREAMSVARLHHPHIVQIYTAGVTVDKRPYLVMQYVKGGTLKDLLQKLHEQRRRLPVRDSLKLVRQVADALNAAHRAGIVHRDIKPSNILLQRDGTPVLTDLGIAAVSTATQLTQTDVTMGTPHYMSPEQAKGQKVDHRADLYALGIILYELLSGSVPFTGDSPLAVMHQHVYEPPSPLALLQPGLSSITYQVVNKALEKEAVDRFSSAAAMMAALDEALAAEATVLPSPRPTPPAPEQPEPAGSIPENTTVSQPLPTAPESITTGSTSRKWWLVGVGLLLLLVCGGSSWLAV